MRAADNRQKAGAGRRTSAFTLIELLAVISIIMTLAAIMIGVANYAISKAKASRTKGEITAMDTALGTYKLQAGAYPAGNGAWNSTINVSIALTNSMSFKPQQLFGNVILDPYGTPYRYLYPGSNNPATFDLWSFGPDGTNGVFGGVNHDLDNFNNWQQQ
jgi:general secretion pathway protein G